MTAEEDDDKTGPDNPRCEALLGGVSRCAYRLGHPGLHWTITQSGGEAQWSDESIARRRALFEDFKRTFEELVSALEADGETQAVEEIKPMFAEVTAAFEETEKG